MSTKLSNQVEFFVMLPDGRRLLPENYIEMLDLENNEFLYLLQKEALDLWQPSSNGESANVNLIKQLKLAEFDPLSDVGHLRYLPKGALMFDLIVEYASRIAINEGALPVHSSSLYRKDAPEISKHLELFGERAYQLKIDNQEFVMRYAACFGQFSLLKDQKFSYRHLPIKLFEIADSYRLEQSGEISGMLRQRRFTMPDMHIICERDNNYQSVKSEFKRLHNKVLEIANELKWNYVSLYNIREDFLNDNQDFISELSKMEGQEVLIRNIGKEEGYYWVLNIEYCIIDAQNRPVEVATIQIDVDNAERFGISYSDSDNSQRFPIIIHSALVGSIERFFDAVLEYSVKKAREKGRKTLLPYWLAPIQVRVIPIADIHMQYATYIYQELIQRQLRVDIDDRHASLSKKIAIAEKQAIEIILIIGDNEIQSNKVNVRDARRQKEYEISLNGLIKIVEERASLFPRKLSYFPKFVSELPNQFQ